MFLFFNMLMKVVKIFDYGDFSNFSYEDVFILELGKGEVMILVIINLLDIIDFGKLLCYFFYWYVVILVE